MNNQMKRILGMGVSSFALVSVLVSGTQSLAQDSTDDNQVVEEVVVTGSYIRRPSQADSSSPISTIGSEDLSEQGISEIADLTRTLTINAGAQNNPDAFTQNLSAGTSNINLRGLGVASTLVLLNGKRQVTSAAQTDSGVSFVDTSSLIPMIAVERVEILRNGAAALYGSDAVGGVANFITKSDFDGFALNAEYRGVTSGDQRDLTVEGMFGHQGDRFRFIVAGSYTDRSALTTRERNLRPPAAAADGLLGISTQTGLPGSFLLPTAPLGNLNDTLAFLTLYDQVMPDFANPAFPLAPNTLANPSAGVTLPAEFAALGITSNPAPPFFPFPSVTGSPVPGSAFTGFRPADAAAGEGVINIPAATAAFLGLGTDAIALGANGIADALEGSVYPSVYAAAAPLIAAGLMVPADSLSFATVPNAEGASLPLFPDPSCMAAVGIIPDVVPLTETFTNPITGETTQVGACGYDFQTPFDLIPKTTNAQVYAQFSADLADGIELYGDFGYTENNTTRNNSNFPITRPIPIAAENPFNTFRAPVLWLGRSPGAGQIANGFTTTEPNPSTHNSDTYRAQGGLRGEFADLWTYDISYTYGRNDFLFAATDGIASRLFLALQGLGGPDCNAATGSPGQGGCQFYNPFGTGILADEGAVAPVLNADFTPVLDGSGNPVLVPVRNSTELLSWLATPLTIDMMSEMSVVDGVITGDVYDMPAGPVSMAFGAQYRSNKLAFDYDSFSNAGDRLFGGQADDFSDTRDVYAFFTEAAVPIHEAIDMQLALRYEDYGNVVGDTLDPKVAVIYRATDDFSFRGSFGTSFRAPSVFQLFGNQTNVQSVDDKRPGQGAPFIAVNTRGNLALKPEQSTNWNFGFTYENTSGFELSVDYWRINFEDVIVQENPQDLADRALLGGEMDLLGTKVIVDPNTGQLLRINADYVNAAFIETDGIDVSLSQTWDVSQYGMFRFGIQGTYIDTYDIPGNTGITVDAADSRNDQNFADPVPDFRANINLTWINDIHSLSFYVRYIDGFRDDENTTFGTLSDGTPDFNNVITDVRVDSMTTVDAQYSVDVSEWLDPLNATITVGVINMFNTRPPFVFTDGAYETRTHDPRGRIAYLRLNTAF